MPLGNKCFSHYKIMNHTNDLFIITFGKSIKLIDYKFTEEAMGYYKLTYKYLPKNYRIEFEYDRMYFSLRINRDVKEFNSINQLLPDEEFNTSLKETNVEKAILSLYNVLENKKEIFYIVKKNKLVRVALKT